MADGTLDRPTLKPAGTFRWEDPLDLRGRLTEDERMIADAAHAYARERLLPRVVSAFSQGRFDREIMTEMGSWACLALHFQRPMAAPRPVTSPMAWWRGRSKRSTPAIARR
jgi:hypothetical protein